MLQPGSAHAPAELDSRIAFRTTRDGATTASGARSRTSPHGCADSRSALKASSISGCAMPGCCRRGRWPLRREDLGQVFEISTINDEL